MKMSNISQQGVALYLTIVILSVLTGTLLTLMSIGVSQIKVIRTLGDSVIAFYAADTGIEEILVDRNNPSDIPLTSLGEAFYQVRVYTSSTDWCTAEDFCIRSIGTYRNTRRAIEITY